MKSNSSQLRQQLDQVIPALRAAGARFASNLSVAYPIYLRHLHGLVRASVPLLVCAEAQARKLAAGSDPVALELAEYFARHTKEESGHDRWIWNDVQALGLNAQNHVLEPIPSSRVATLVGQQYYWISHHHPISLLGYIAVIEGYPPSPAQLDDWQRRTGFPPNAFITLHKHALIDPFHRRDVDALLDSLELSEALVQMISKSALHTVLHVVELLEEIAEEAEETARAAASRVVV